MGDDAGYEVESIVIDRDELLQVLRDLVGIESVNPFLGGRGSGEGNIARYIKDYLERVGLEVKTQAVDADRINVIGTVKGTGNGKSILLNGHTDTVNVDEMSIDPFRPRLKDGRVYGRGVLDMKSGLAAMMVAVKSIMTSGRRMNGDIILAFVADEEYRSSGTEELVKAYAADAAIVCEPTNLNIAIAHKGFAWAKVEVHGKRAHGSLPDSGIDAIVKAGKVLIEIERLGNRLRSERGHPLLGFPSVHASLISGGVELSTYPDYCTIELERRTVPGEDRGTFIQELKDIVERIHSEDDRFTADFDVFFYRQPHEISKDSAIVQSLGRAEQLVLEKEPTYSGVHFWTDAALLAEAGIPTAVFGPRGEGLHASNEYVDFDSVVATAHVLVEAITDFCHS